MANMLPSYCIPAQRLAVTAIARGASALQRTFTALATPWDAAVLTPAPTPCLVGSVGGGVGVSCQVPNTVNQRNFGRFWHRTEINIAHVPGYEIANCLSEIVRHTCLIVPAYSFTPRGMVCTRTLQPLGHVGGGMVNMLSRYCIPAQRMAATAIAHGVFLLQIACTVPAAPRGTAFSATAPTPRLLGFIGGGLAAGLGLAAALCQTP